MGSFEEVVFDFKSGFSQPTVINVENTAEAISIFLRINIFMEFTFAII